MLCEKISSKSGILYLKTAEGNFAKDAPYLSRHLSVLEKSCLKFLPGDFTSMISLT
jgi:hypothetical protein